MVTLGFPVAIGSQPVARQPESGRVDDDIYSGASNCAGPIGHGGNDLDRILVDVVALVRAYADAQGAAARRWRWWWRTSRPIHRYVEAVQHQIDGISQRSGRATGEQQPYWVVAVLCHHQRAGVAPPR